MCFMSWARAIDSVETSFTVVQNLRKPASESISTKRTLGGAGVAMMAPPVAVGCGRLADFKNVLKGGEGKNKKACFLPK